MANSATNNTNGTATSRPTVAIRVSAAVTVAGDRIFSPSTTFTTCGNPYRTVENLITSVTADITRGWAGKSPDSWGPRAERYAETGGRGAVQMTVSIGDSEDGYREEFLAEFETTESVARAIVNATHVVSDEAQAWAMDLKRKAAGYNR